MRIRTKLMVPLLALLAVMSAPAVGHAETSGEKVYHPALPGFENEPSEAQKPEKDHSRPPGPKRDDPGPEEAPEPDEEAEEKPSVATPGGDDPPRDDGAPETRRKTANRTPAVGNSKPVAVPHAQERSNSDRAGVAAGGGGGSSPLIPILIAAAVLAALSIGVAIRRERLRPSRR